MTDNESRRSILKQIDMELTALEDAVNKRRISFAKIDKQLSALQLPDFGQENLAGILKFGCPRPVTHRATSVPASVPSSTSSIDAYLPLAAGAPDEPTEILSFADWLREHQEFCLGERSAHADQGQPEPFSRAEPPVQSQMSLAPSRSTRVLTRALATRSASQVDNLHVPPPVSRADDPWQPLHRSQSWSVSRSQTWSVQTCSADSRMRSNLNPAGQSVPGTCNSPLHACKAALSSPPSSPSGLGLPHGAAPTLQSRPALGRPNTPRPLSHSPLRMCPATTRAHRPSLNSPPPRTNRGVQLGQTSPVAPALRRSASASRVSEDSHRRVFGKAGTTPASASGGSSTLAAVAAPGSRCSTSPPGSPSGARNSACTLAAARYASAASPGVSCGPSRTGSPSPTARCGGAVSQGAPRAPSRSGSPRPPAAPLAVPQLRVPSPAPGPAHGPLASPLPAPAPEACLPEVPAVGTPVHAPPPVCAMVRQGIAHAWVEAVATPRFPSTGSTASTVMPLRGLFAQSFVFYKEGLDHKAGHLQASVRDTPKRSGSMPLQASPGLAVKGAPTSVGSKASAPGCLWPPTVQHAYLPATRPKDCSSLSVPAPEAQQALPTQGSGTPDLHAVSRASSCSSGSRTHLRSFSEVKLGSFAEGLEQWVPAAGAGSFQARAEATFAPAATHGQGGRDATYTGPQPLPRGQPQCPVQ